MKYENKQKIRREIQSLAKDEISQLQYEILMATLDENYEEIHTLMCDYFKIGGNRW